uniref:Alpha/beta hydrolase fold-3 domain-containing protein n=1 Tax=Pinguiococcus pyrenoidosus TaxID=172671 RepID=A0A7R9YCN2_9STRA
MRHMVSPVRSLGFKGMLITSGLAPPSKPAALDEGTRGDERHVVFYIHGGGYHIGHPLQQLFWLCSLRWRMWRRYRRCAAIFCLDYTLSDVGGYPLQISEANAAYDWLSSSFEPRRILLMGDSAGGNAALALCHSVMNRARRYREGREGKGDLSPAIQDFFGTIPGEILPAGVITLSPWLDLRCESHAYERNRLRDWLDAGLLKYWAERYVGKNGSPHSGAVSPGLESPSKLGNLPLYVTGGGDELLADDFHSFGRRCREERAAGCTILDVREHQVHDHSIMFHAMGLASACDALDRLACVSSFMWDLNSSEKMAGNLLDIGHADLATVERVLTALRKHE